MRLTKKWVAKFIHNSNGIEGIYTPEDHILAILNGEVQGRSSLILNQIKAVEYVKKNKKKVPSIAMICELHQILLENIDSWAGVIRRSQVFVGKHVPPASERVLYHLENWVNLWGKSPVASWTNKKTCMFRHYEFEWIHPFCDGNGRVGRLLLLWDCLHNNTSMDIIECENAKRFDYYRNLEEYECQLRDKYLSRWALREG